MSRTNLLEILVNLDEGLRSLVLSTPVESDVQVENERNSSHLKLAHDSNSLSAAAAVETTEVVSNFWRALVASGGGTRKPSSLAVVAF